MLQRITVASLWLAALLLLSPTESLGQSIVDPSSPNRSAEWPSPVRSVQHVEADPSFEPIPVELTKPPLHPHHVIAAPPPPGAEMERVRGPHHGGPDKFHFPFHPSHHAPLQASNAKLPRANLRKTWKTPYSYGYFGASGTRHWSLHHGYRDRYTEWRLR